jgi:hypothetical protein
MDAQAPPARKRKRGKRKLISPGPNKVGWRIDEWCADLAISRAFFYASIINEVDTVKLGAMTIVTTSPKDYLARKAAQQAQAAD